ncbi:hypothetical protein GUITHDRAFT_140370 [Guillardia theta CCMP2712]|uniref:Uncharacterized protein n=1 Tax=Guillardia theta (strain CCMP2712) TaxID=905079 RepID=L1J504_GUITC|nr:hypothetical protein GUITHDRAFT_140370 [Guillardia theta CCMP2712]EKX43613.1 hypothetical protein GUITHDRAFT_140370 [Guillardia theta CCMP2712]|eukprot:XP_005830593.1 hypothetical protein GUITHDRAFT_140370 [Guillardia theta CCMP2712]
MSSPPHDASPLRSDRSFSASRRDAGSLVVDDLLQGMNEWRNIQDVIRSTFKALHDVIKAQGDAVKSLERQLEGKASSADVQAALQRKANIADVNRSISDIAHSLETKALVGDLDNKPDRDEVQKSALKGKASLADVTSELDRKADRDEIESFRSQVEKHLNDLSSKLEEQSREIERRALRDEVTSQLLRKMDISPFEEKFGSVGPHRTVAQILYNKVDNATLDKAINNMMDEESYCNGIRHNDNISKLSMRLDAVDSDMYASKTSVHKQSSDLQMKMETLAREVSQLTNTHQGSSTSLLEMKTLISQNNAEYAQQISKMRADCKADMNEVESSLGFKIKTEITAARDQFERRLMDTVQELDERIENLKTFNRRILDNLEKEISIKADKSALDKKIGYDAMDESLAIQEQSLQRVVSMVMMDGIHKEMEQKYKNLDEECLTETEELKRDMRKKADIKEVNLLIDSKADVDEVDVVLARCLHLLPLLFNLPALSHPLTPRPEVNRALLDVNGQLSLKASMADISSTLHEQVMLNSALITELCLGRWIWKSLKTKLGIFSRKKPTVKVQVNGEPILTISPQSRLTADCQSYLLIFVAAYNNMEGEATQLGQVHQQASNITGLTHIDFLALPSRARIAIAYQGDEDAEAFLGLRKL